MILLLNFSLFVIMLIKAPINDLYYLHIARLGFVIFNLKLLIIVPNCK